jgi:hypothetical protein
MVCPVAVTTNEAIVVSARAMCGREASPGAVARASGASATSAAFDGSRFD